MTTYTSNFLSSKSVSGTPDVYATAKQDYTGLTLNGTDLVLGQGYFANFDTTADSLPALSSASWAGLGFFSEELSTDTVWEPKGSYFLSETACVVPSTDESQRVDSRLLRISSGTLYAFYVGGSSTTNLTVGATVNSNAISFGNSEALATTDAANTDEANIAYIIRRVKQNTEIAPFRYSGSLITSGQVGSITVTNPGSGYTSVPTVTISGGGSSSASATAVLSGTTVGSITVTNPGNGYTTAPTVTISGGGGSRAAAVASLFPNLNLQNIMMASEGATDKDSYKYEITPQKAVVSRSIGDLYTFNYPKTDNTAQETYDFATGGDGVVAIGATDSFVSVSEYGASDSAFTAAPFGGSSTGNFDWPATSEIQISDAGFLYSDLKKIFKTRSYGHSYNMDLGLNFDLGTNDGNDINLATNWSYSNFFRGDAAKRYAMADGVSDKPASMSGWKIHPTFDVDLTSDFPVSGIDETAVKAFVAIKNGLSTAVSPASWIALLFHASDKDKHPLPKNAWQAGLPDNLVAGPADSDGNQLITDDNFKDYSESTEQAELKSSFGLTSSCLSVERSVGATASYTKGDSHSIWENETGTSSVETKFPAPESDGGWGYWERSNSDQMKSYSQTGTINATTHSTTKVSSDVIDREITSSAHFIDFGFTWVPHLSLGINLHGVKTSFGHTPPSKVDVDFGLTRLALDIKGVHNVIKMSSIVNLTEGKVDENKITFSGGKNEFFCAPFSNNLTGCALKVGKKTKGASLKATGTQLSSRLMTSFFLLTETKAAAAEVSANNVDLAAGETVLSGGIGLNTGPEVEITDVVDDPLPIPAPPPVATAPVRSPGTLDAKSVIPKGNTARLKTQLAETAPVRSPGPSDAKSVIPEGNTARLRKIYENKGKGNLNNT